MKIYFELDRNCISEDKIILDALGGTERFFIKWAGHLRDTGHEVGYYPYEEPKGQWDVCVYSNSGRTRMMANVWKHILWGGSWHIKGLNPDVYDLVILNSQYMKDELGWENAIVIPAPFDSDVLLWKNKGPKKIDRKILCHANPNRHYKHTRRIAEELLKKGYEFTWHLTGGNKLYSPRFGESAAFSDERRRLLYHGPIRRILMLEQLASSHIWAYPNFSDDSETLGVAAIEAAALGLPVILPDRRPFTDILPQAIFCKNVHEFTEAIILCFDKFPISSSVEFSPPFMYDVQGYRSDVVYPKLTKVIEDLMEGER